MLTFLYVLNRTAIFMDTNFNIKRTVKVSLEGELPNMHELHLVDNGTRALYFYDETRNASKPQSESIGFTQWNCPIRENSIRELDLTNDKLEFTWSSSNYIDLTESTFTERTVEDRCTNMEKGWDYIHCNSLDKFPEDGAYLMSGRYTDTIYKIARDGSIVWRLGGKRSDFRSDFKFARQHHARILDHNATHTVLSFLDNAKAEDYEEAATPYSRGLVVALSTAVQPMIATMLREYPHPGGEGAYSLGRGSTQVLSNGNVFSCWVSGCLHSEHTEDGTLVMEARVKQEYGYLMYSYAHSTNLLCRWLKSYRSYKFPFIGRPSSPPNIHSATDTVNGRTKTIVHVSWNGATEVATWLLYKADSTGKHWAIVTSSSRTGFETAIKYDGYAKYVFVEALDRARQPLGRSNVIETTMPTPVAPEILALEDKWLERQRGRIEYWRHQAKYTAETPLGISSFWIMSSVALAVVGRMAYRWRRRATRR